MPNKPFGGGPDDIWYVLLLAFGLMVLVYAAIYLMVEMNRAIGYS